MKYDVPVYGPPHLCSLIIVGLVKYDLLVYGPSHLCSHIIVGLVKYDVPVYGPSHLCSRIIVGLVKEQTGTYVRSIQICSVIFLLSSVVGFSELLTKLYTKFKMLLKKNKVAPIC